MDAGGSAWQASHAVSQPVPIPLRPALEPRSAPNNLPAQITSFVGRERDRAEIVRLLRSSTRLVTLTGAGGVGKTRLGLGDKKGAVIAFRPKNGTGIPSLSFWSTRIVR